jgi:hypothetical protein
MPSRTLRIGARVVNSRLGFGWELEGLGWGWSQPASKPASQRASKPTGLWLASQPASQQASKAARKQDVFLNLHTDFKHFSNMQTRNIIEIVSEKGNAW